MQTTDTLKQNPLYKGIIKFVKSLPPLTWAVAVMIIFFAVVEPSFFNVANLSNIVRRGSQLWMIATMATLLLISGAIDLSLGAVLSFSGAVLALLLDSGTPAVWAIFAAILSGTLVGAINGFLVSVFGIPAFIVTLGTMNVFAGLAVYLTFPGALFISNPAVVAIAATSIAGIPVPIWVGIITFVISFIILHHTSFGRNLVAVGQNATGAHLSGVNVKKTTWSIFIYAGTVAAIAGVVLASRIQSADPTIGRGWEFEAIAASIMGGTLRGKGKGSITTTIVGVVLILGLRNGLNIMGVPVMWRTAIVGLFLLAGIVFDISMRRRENSC